MLSVPFIAAVFAGLHSIQKQLFVSVAIILFAYSIPFLILNETRSFVALANNSILAQVSPINLTSSIDPTSILTTVLRRK